MSVSYEVSFPRVDNHYIHVRMTIDSIGAEEMEVSLPVWTPGSYLVREYAQHIESIKARSKDGRTVLDMVKTDKNTWHIPVGRRTSIIIDYDLYCKDATVRTNYADKDQATIIGANTFLYIDGGQSLPSTIEFKPKAGWKDIATSLPQKGRSKWKRSASNYDEIVDSPIVIGTLTFYDFDVSGVPHKLAVYGEGNADMPKLVKDLQRVCEEEVALFREMPCDEYLFILLLTENRYNGLEHLNSSLNQLPRLDFYPRAKYQRSMGLLSHEYFHLWNVKRIRPAALSSFDYDKEVYTRQLWVAEGITSNYDDYVLYLSEIFTREEYLKVVAKMLNGVVNNPGDDVQSLTEASHDAWLKYYRRNANSNNNLVTYYDKGATTVHALNMLIMHESKGERSFDDVLKVLWKDYKADPDEGFTEAEFQAMVEQVAGVPLGDFFKRHIYGTEPIDYPAYFKYAGLELVDANTESKSVYLGMSASMKEGKLIISKLDKHYGAYKAGLNTGDEIVAINGYRVMKDYKRFFDTRKVGDKIKVLYSRNGEIMETTVTLTADKRVNYVFQEIKRPGKTAQKVRDKWLVR